MKILSNIPFTLDQNKIFTQARVKADSRYAAELLKLLELAGTLGKPKAAYRVGYITARAGDEVEIDGQLFRSRTLARNLADVERVFAVVATCGREVDEGYSAKGDMLYTFWWDLIKTHLLGAANAFLSEHLRDQYRLKQTATMRPGSGDAAVWPIEQQKNLFTLLGDVEGEIGVRLTESFLMWPNKTVSGLTYPAEKDFRTCEVCHRENCPGRQAPFNEHLWHEIGLED